MQPLYQPSLLGGRCPVHWRGSGTGGIGAWMLMTCATFDGTGPEGGGNSAGDMGGGSGLKNCKPPANMSLKCHPGGPLDLLCFFFFFFLRPLGF